MRRRRERIATMLNSVRVRLTLWYTGAMTVVLVVLAVATYVVLKENVIRRADAAAVELADSFLTTVNAELSDIPQSENSRAAIAAAISEHKFQDVIFIVLDSHNSLLGMSEGREDAERKADPSSDLLSRLPGPARPGESPFRSVHFGRRSYRSYVRNFSIAQQPATLIVLQSLHRQNEFLETLTASFAIAIPLTLVLAGFGGYLLARRSLSPVVSMSTQASRIGAENLDGRLQVKNPHDELGKLALSFNDLLDRLSASFDRQRRFVADASHELRTPVAILCGEADVTLSKTDRSPQEYRESLQILGKEAKRLKHIVEDLFTLARADAGQHPLVLSDFYLDELAAESCRNVRTLASAKQISVQCETEAELPIRADETLVRRMLLNLLDNAIKYTPPSGSVHIFCGAQDGQYRLRVEDSGVGIPPELQPRIFERFFRGDMARSHGENDGGAGLGLAIASWIAEVHGGKLELVSSNENGSTFTVSLPKVCSER